MEPPPRPTADGQPPGTTLPTLIVLGIQHGFLIVTSLLIAAAVLRAAGVSDDDLPAHLGLSTIALAVTNVAMVMRLGRLGSGVLVPMQVSSIFLVPALSAAAIGQLPMVAGMSLFTAIILILLVPFLRILRPYFPTEIAGLVIVVIGIDLANRGVTLILGDGSGTALALPERSTLGVVTLATVIGFAVWARESLQRVSILAGLLVGAVVGAVLYGTGAPLGGVAPLAAPAAPVLSVGFSGSLVIIYVISALSLLMTTTGNIATAQQLADPKWVRPQIGSIQGGVLATALGMALSGFSGTPGIAAGSSNVGLARATGVIETRLVWVIAGFLVLLGISPMAMVLILSVPAPVTGALWLVLGSYVLVGGVSVMTSRILDTRKALVIGLSLPIGLSAQIYPEVYAALPAWLHPITSHTLVLGTLSAVFLNALFRIGVARRAELVLTGDAPDGPQIQRFMKRQGGAWAARADVIEKATFTLAQLLEYIRATRGAEARVGVVAEFDEFNLRVMVTHSGAGLDFPQRRPTPRQIVASEDGANLLAGYLVRRSVNGLNVTERDGMASVALHFEH